MKKTSFLFSVFASLLLALVWVAGSAVPADADVLLLSSPMEPVVPARVVVFPHPSYSCAYPYAYVAAPFPHPVYHCVPTAPSCYVVWPRAARPRPISYVALSAQDCAPLVVPPRPIHAYPAYPMHPAYPTVAVHPVAVPVLPCQAAVSAREVTLDPAWRLEAQFRALAGWRNHVDRVGALGVSGVPVAWKGTSPKTVYVWAGGEWQKIPLKKRQRPEDALRNHPCVRGGSMERDGGPDVEFLSRCAAAWGYRWMGWIYP